MANEKMDLIKHMALLRNVANDVTEIMSSTAAADFINAAIEIINDYPSDGKLVDTGNSGLNIPDVSNRRELLIAFLMEIDECYGMHVRKEAEKCVDNYLKGNL